MAVLEIIAFNVESAKAAELSGADRLELCENSAVGGTTPSYGFIKFCQEKISIPCFPMIRPRGGNFFYSAEEIGVIKADTIMCRELGCPGIVTGMLSPDGQIDTQTLKEIISLAGPMQVTFHRAFDRCIDPFKALEDIIHAGCTRMLSSGQAATAMEGAMLLKELQEQAGDRIIIMPGSGVRSSTVKELAHITRAQEFHSSAACKIKTANHPGSKMQEVFLTDAVDEAEVAKMKAILLALKPR